MESHSTETPSELNSSPLEEIDSPHTSLLSQENSGDVELQISPRRREVDVDIENNSDSDEDEEEESVQNTRTSLWNQYSTPLFSSRFWRRANYAACLYFLPMTIALGTVLLVDWNKTCNKPLKLWALIQFILQISVILINIIIINKLPSNELSSEAQERIIRGHRRYYLVNRIALSLTFLWVIVGAYFTFSTSDCAKSIPFLYKITHSIMITQLVNLLVLCAFLLLYSVIRICGINTSGMMEIPNRALSGQSNPRALPVDSINSLEVKSFSEDLDIAKEDASCAICLSSYEKGEQIKFLPCQKAHHFHKKCIDQWLFAYDKCCPMCKKEIETKV